MDKDQEALVLLRGRLQGDLASAQEHIRKLGDSKTYPRCWGYYIGVRDTCRRLLELLDGGDRAELWNVDEPEEEWLGG